MLWFLEALSTITWNMKHNKESFQFFLSLIFNVGVKFLSLDFHIYIFRLFFLCLCWISILFCPKVLFTNPQKMWKFSRFSSSSSGWAQRVSNPIAPSHFLLIFKLLSASKVTSPSWLYLSTEKWKVLTWCWYWVFLYIYLGLIGTLWECIGFFDHISIQRKTFCRRSCFAAISCGSQVRSLPLSLGSCSMFLSASGGGMERWTV